MVFIYSHYELGVSISLMAEITIFRISSLYALLLYARYCGPRVFLKSHIFLRLTKGIFYAILRAGANLYGPVTMPDNSVVNGFTVTGANGILTNPDSVVEDGSTVVGANGLVTMPDSVAEN